MATTGTRRNQIAVQGKQAGTARRTPIKKSATPDERKVLYSDITTEVRMGDSALTIEDAKRILGWREEDDPKKNPFGNKFTLLYDGKKVRCDNNISNRPIYMGNVQKLVQDVLNHHWWFNGEPIIIGRTGLVLNGQHTLLTLIFATLEITQHPELYTEWADKPVTLDKLIVYGISEEDKVVNTMDTCKPRSLADVIYRAHYFKNLSSQAQMRISNLLKYALDFVYDRAKEHNSIKLKKTNPTMIEFLESHRTLLKAARHIYDEDSEGKLSKFYTPGYLAGMLYLMAASDTEPNAYYSSDTPTESNLDFSRWDKACEFFVNLAAGSPSFKPVKEAIAKLYSEGFKDRASRYVVLVKAWGMFKEGSKITSAVYPKMELDDEKELVLAESPLIGGIDVGEEGLGFIANGDPTPEQIEQGMETVQIKKGNAQHKARRASGNEPGKPWAEGDYAWVHEQGNEVYFARLKIEPFAVSGKSGALYVFVDSADGEWEVPVASLSLKKHELVA